ncbi:MAG: hypothetical protein Q8N08_00265 [Methanobacteriaceae archaeon]|nr:hypothetical protein [Methanobacteriaceae archaeon]
MIFDFILTSLALTVVVEATLWWIILRDKPLKIVGYAVLINFLTLPLAQFTYFYLLNNLFFLEVVVVLVESLLIMLLFQIKYPKALYVSILANLASAVLGLWWVYSL